MEELLRDDRRMQLRRGDRCSLAGLVGAAALEVPAHVGHVEPHDLVAQDVPDLPVVVRDELHSTPQTFMATRAYTSAVLTRPSISRFSPSSTSISPVEVP